MCPGDSDSAARFQESNCFFAAQGRLPTSREWLEVGFRSQLSPHFTNRGKLHHGLPVAAYDYGFTLLGELQQLRTANPGQARPAA